MNKKLLFTSLLSLCLLATGCSGDDSSTPESSTTPSSTNPSSTEDSSTSGYDFTTSLSSNGVTADEDSYLISTISPEHESYANSDVFKASLTFSCDSSWSIVTSLNSNYTVLTSEDQSVIPDDAMELSTILDSHVVGQTGSNEIVGLRIRINRSMISVGTTNILLQVRPGSGSTTVTSVTANLCVPVTVAEYGTIELDTYTISLNVDLSDLDSKLGNLTPTTLTFYFYDNEQVYGASETYTISANLLDLEEESLRYTDIKYPVGHTFMVYVYAYDGSDAISLAFVPSETSSSYTYSIAINTTYLEVLEDNATINLKLQ